MSCKYPGVWKEGIPVSLYDTKGLEMKDYRNTLSQVLDLVKNKNNQEDHTKHIHAAWLCLSEDSSRVEDAEIELCKLLSDNNIPVIVVITKARSNESFKETVEDILDDARNVVRVRAIDETIGDMVIPTMGLDTLVSITNEVIPEGQKAAFSASQKISLDLKIKSANKIIVASVSAATVAAASPIPFSDAIPLSLIQIGMIAKISSVFGLTLSSDFIKILLSTLGTSAGASIVGRTLVSGILKFIPGLGTITGGVISASTAALLTTTFGNVYVKSLSFVINKNNGVLPTNEEIKIAFESNLNKK